MVNVFDVDAEKFLAALAEELKKMDKIKAPEWTFIVKTGVHVERPPTQPDFWYRRTASILRSLYIHGPKGVQKMRVKYGGRKNRGVKEQKVYKAGGKIIRVAFQQLESEGLVSKVMKKGKKGRQLTPKAVKLMDNLAYKVFKA